MANIPIPGDDEGIKDPDIPNGDGTGSNSLAPWWEAWLGFTGGQEVGEIGHPDLLEPIQGMFSDFDSPGDVVSSLGGFLFDIGGPQKLFQNEALQIKSLAEENFAGLEGLPFRRSVAGQLFHGNLDGQFLGRETPGDGPFGPGEDDPDGGDDDGTSIRDTITLESILQRILNPALDESKERRSTREAALMEALGQPTDFGSVREEVSAVGEGVANELFSQGGQVESAINEALRNTARTGFGPTSGSFDRARLDVLRGASDQVANRVAQSATQLAPLAQRERATDLGILGGLAESEAARVGNLRQSIFGGRASVNQLQLAQDQADLNEQLVNQALESGETGFLEGVGNAATGALGGAVAGSQFLPGPGTAIGAILGGLGGLFGG